MGNNLQRITVLEEIGCFSIKSDGFIIIDIYPRSRRITTEKIKFLNELGREKIERTSILTDLVVEEIHIDEKIEKLISLGFFYDNLDKYLKYCISSQVIIVKGSSVGCRSPKTIIESGIPNGLKLVDAKSAFHVAYLLSFFATLDFLNIHNMNRLFIMSEPLEKFNEHDDNLVVRWSPRYSTIGTGLYENPYSGDSDAGYVFYR